MRATPALAARAAPLTILVVEDDAGDAHLIAQALAASSRATEIIFAIDGVAALAALAQLKRAPDIAFVDLHMPRMNGYRLVRALTEGGAPKFPIIVLTSAHETGDVVRSVVESAARVMSKPSSLAELKAMLEDLLAAL